MEQFKILAREYIQKGQHNLVVLRVLANFPVGGGGAAWRRKKGGGEANGECIKLQKL